MAVRQRWRRWQLGAVLGVLALLGVQALAQDDPVVERMRKDLTFLASDECEGRGVFTEGINKAADHIAASFKESGLKPAGPNGSYFQPFQIRRGASKLQGTPTLTLRGPQGQEITLKAGTDFQALGFSDSGKVSAPLVFAGYGVTAPGLGYDDFKDVDVAGKVVVLVRRTPRYDSPAGFDGGNRDTHAALARKFANAAQHKAAAVLLVNDRSEQGDKLVGFGGFGTATVDGLQVLQVRRPVLDALLLSSLGTGLRELEADIDRDLKPRSAVLPGWQASLQVEVVKPKAVTAKNVVGVLEGSGPLAKETVVIGAHYDHLGYGEYGSRAKDRTKKQIHYGADDNASGTTTVLELARRFGRMKDRQGRRLVFMTFSGEELGLLGSAHYCDKEPLFPLADTVTMVNLDMVGRLRKVDGNDKEQLLVGGVGTSKTFEKLIDSLNEKHGFQLKKSASGFGPSDHASFYRNKVPVFFVWTGLHPKDRDDYHRPTDTADRINVAGMKKIADLVEPLVVELSTAADRPQYLPTGAEPGSRPANLPRLGIRPGNYDEKNMGVKVDDVIAGGPADLAGIKAGDVIVRIAGQPVGDIGAYMTILAKQKRGAPVEIGILRGAKEITVKATPK
jgi:hypothetical protein